MIAVDALAKERLRVVAKMEKKLTRLRRIERSLGSYEEVPHGQ